MKRLRLLQVYMDFSETKYTFHRSLIETPQYFMCHNLWLITKCSEKHWFCRTDWNVQMESKLLSKNIFTTNIKLERNLNFNSLQISENFISFKKLNSFTKFKAAIVRTWIHMLTTSYSRFTTFLCLFIQNILFENKKDAIPIFKFLEMNELSINFEW